MRDFLVKGITPRRKAHACSRCGQWISQEVLDAKYEATAKKISEAWNRARLEGRFGRKRFDYVEIRRLLDSGLTHKQVAEKIGCHRSVVFRAAKEV